MKWWGILAGVVLVEATRLALAAPFGSQPDAVYTDAQARAALASQLATLQASIPTVAQMAAAAPVQAVNTKTGLVSVPTLCRQQSGALTIPTTNPGVVSWSFPNTTCSFSTPPSCWMDVSTATGGYAFDQPLNTARSTSAVTYSFTAHASILTISLGSLSLTAGAPANSTVTMTCTASPA